MAETWLNNDGLLIKYGRGRSDMTTKGGEYCASDGGYNVVTIDLDMTTLTQTPTIVNDVVALPANSQIMEVRTRVLTAATAGSAWQFGLIQRDRSTAIDVDGLIDSAATTTVDAIGETATYTATSSAPKGALIGTIVTAESYFVAAIEASTVYTAGLVRIEVVYRPTGA